MEEYSSVVDDQSCVLEVELATIIVGTDPVVSLSSPRH